jgi:nitrite reductase/ring-hydroxylating ferredoxin subunit
VPNAAQGGAIQRVAQELLPAAGLTWGAATEPRRYANTPKPMPGRVQISEASEVPLGALETFDAAGHSIVLARVGDGFCAVAAKCPHMGGPMGKGRLEGSVIVCPRQSSRFDTCTGHVRDWVPAGAVARRLLTLGRPPASITTYRKTEEDGKLYAEL